MVIDRHILCCLCMHDAALQWSIRPFSEILAEAFLLPFSPSVSPRTITKSVPCSPVFAADPCMIATRVICCNRCSVRRQAVMLATFVNLWRHHMAVSGLAMHPALVRGHTAMRCAHLPCFSLACLHCYVCLPAQFVFGRSAQLYHLLACPASLSALLCGACLSYLFGFFTLPLGAGVPAATCLPGKLLVVWMLLPLLWAVCHTYV